MKNKFLIFLIPTFLFNVSSCSASDETANIYQEMKNKLNLFFSVTKTGRIEKEKFFLDGAVLFGMGAGDYDFRTLYYSFRDELLKIIDEDYYFTLKWFLTDEYGFNIRDKISHRLKSVDLYKTKFAIYISLHIFRLYWGFQK